MISPLTGDQKKHIQGNVRSVINGDAEEWSAENEHYPLMALKVAILEIEGVTEVDRDTNGWQWDYWQYFKFSEDIYTLSGSGYYGGQSFRKKEQP